MWARTLYFSCYLAIQIIYCTATCTMPALPAKTTAAVDGGQVGAGATVPDTKQVTFMCNPNYAAAEGSNLIRTCTAGVLSPTLSASPIVCAAQCKVPALPASTTATVDNKAVVKDDYINEGKKLVLACPANHVPKAGEKFTRTCTSGSLDAPFDSNNPTTCEAQCKIPDVPKSTATVDSKTVVKDAYINNGKKVIFKCVAGHAAKDGEVLTRTCNLGKFDKAFDANNPITCSGSDRIGGIKSALLILAPLVSLICNYLF